MNNESAKKLYDALSVRYDLGTFDKFTEGLQDENRRRKIYDAVSGTHDLGDYDTFTSKLGLTTASDGSVRVAEEAEEIAEEMQPQGAITPQATPEEIAQIENFNNANIFPQMQDTNLPFRTIEEKKESARIEEQIAAEEAALAAHREAERKRLHEDGTIDRMKEAKKEAGKRKRNALWESMKSAMILAEGAAFAPEGTGERLKEQTKEYSQNKLLNENLDEVLDMARQGELNADGTLGVMDAARGAWDSATRISTWDAGYSDAINGMTYYSLIQKWQNDPESLTATEEALLDALATTEYVNSLYSDQTGFWYGVGQSLPQSAAFMAETMANPANALGQTAMKKVVRELGKRGVSAAARRGAGITTRVVGDIAEAAIGTATTRAGHVIGGAIDRNLGSMDFRVDNNGYVHYEGQEDDGVDGWEAMSKEFGAQFLGGYSEKIGATLIDPALDVLRGVTKGAVTFERLDKFVDALNNTKASKLMNGISNLRKKAHLDSTLAEILEEEFDMLMNARFIGDNNFGDPSDPNSVFNLRNQLTTIASTALTMFGINAVESAGNYANKRTWEKQVAEFDKAAGKLYGDGWEALRESIDMKSPQEVVDELTGIFLNQDVTLEQKRAIMNYAMGRIGLQSYNVMDKKVRDELYFEKRNALDAYEAGRHAQLPQYYNINQEYRRSEAAINERENAEEIWDAIRLMNNMDENERQNIMRDFSEEEQELIRNWRYNAMRWQGAINHRAEQIEDLVDEYAGQVNPYTRPDGTVTTAVLGDNVVYVMSEAENGDAVVYTNDGRKIFCKMRDLEHVQQHNAEELIERFRQQTTEVVNQETEKNLSYPSEVQEPAEGVIVETLDGKQWQVAATDGENVEIVGLIFDKKSGQWIPNSGDYRKMTREQFMDWQKAELDRKKANTYEHGDELTFYVNGEPISAEITGIDPDGNYYVHVSNLVEGLDKAVSDVYTAEELRKLTTPSSKVLEKTTENESTPSEEIKQSVSDKITNSQIEGNVTKPTAEVAESVNTPQTKAAELLAELDEDEVDENIAYNTQKAIDLAGEKRKAKPTMKDADGDVATYKALKAKWEAELNELQRDVLFWSNVAKEVSNARVASQAIVPEVEAVAEAEQPVVVQPMDMNPQPVKKAKKSRKRESVSFEGFGETAMKTANDIMADKAPQNGVELAAAMLSGSNGKDKIRLTPESFRKHTGYTTKEQGKFVGLFSSNGVSMERMGELVMQADREDGTNFFDQNDANAGLNAVLEVLGQAETMADINQYITRNREEVAWREASAIQRQEDEQEQMAKDAWYMEKYGATEEELIAYSELMNEIVSDYAPTEEELQNVYSIFAEQLEYGNEGTTESISRPTDSREGQGETVDGDNAVGEGDQYAPVETAVYAEGGAAEAVAETDAAVRADADVESKPTANVFEMAEEVQKKRKEKKDDTRRRSIQESPAEADRVSGELFGGESLGEGESVSSRGDGGILEEGTGKKKRTAKARRQSDNRQEARDGKAERLSRGISAVQQQAIDEYTRTNPWDANLTDDERGVLNMYRMATINELDELAHKLADKINSGKATPRDRMRYDVLAAYAKSGELKAVADAMGVEYGKPVSLDIIKSLFETFNSDADLAKLFDRVFPLVEKINPTIIYRRFTEADIEEGEDVSPDDILGQYSLQENLIEYNRNQIDSNHCTEQEKASTIVHEMIHAVARYAIRVQEAHNNGVELDIQLPKRLLDAAQALIEVYDAIKDNEIFNDDRYESGKMYGVSSVHEMLSELANPEFREKLKQVSIENLPSDKKGRVRDALRAIKDFIHRMFGWDSSSAYARTKRALDKLIDNYDSAGYNKARELADEDFAQQRTYHGSGAQFDKFNHSFMGTGEGNQAFGWGTYVSEAEGVGKTYAKIASKPMLTYKGQEMNVDGYENPWRVIKDLYDMTRGKISQMRADAEKYERLAEDDSPFKPVWGEIIGILKNARRGDIKVTPRRVLYSVEIPDDNGSNYLKWYKNVPKEALTKAKAKLYGVLVEGDYKGAERELKRELDDLFSLEQTGQNLYGNISAYLGSDKEASQFLHEMGYVGIKYPTNTLHGGNIDGTNNYVIFNENDLEIVDNIRFRDGAPFFSNAERAVENIKQQKATPEQWLAMIKKDGGLKAGEDKWMGLSDWLTEQKENGVKSLTKDEVLAFIRANEVQIEEVNYEEGVEDARNDAEEAIRESLQEMFDAKVDEVRNENPEQIYMSDIYEEAFERVCAEVGYNKDDAPFVYTNATITLRWYPIVTTDELLTLSRRLGFSYEDSLSIPNAEQINSTRLDYTTEGLDNKKEIAFVVPNIESWNQSDEIHFGDAGEGRAVAWVRFGETTDEDGKRVLVIDEVQSKRHDEGRAKGYQSKEKGDLLAERDRLYDKMYRDGLTEEEFNRRNEINARLEELGEGRIPDAPFDKNYHELVMKRMLRYAAENGFDKVAWTKGKQQAQRYGLSTKVSEIAVKANNKGTYNVVIEDMNGSELMDYRGSGKEMTSEELSALVGKELSSKLIEGARRSQGLEWSGKGYNPEFYTIRGVDLSIGGEDRNALYDEMIPRFMNKYTKKWGTKVGEVTLPNVEEAGRTMWSVDVTPEMRESVMQGQPMFREGMGAISDREVSYENDPIAKWDGKPRYYGKRAAAFAERERRRMQKGVEDAAKILGIEVEIITDASTLKGRKAKAKGWYDINSKKVVVVVPNHVSKGDAVRTVLHEGVAHHGLRELFGDGFDAMLDNIYNNVAPELKARIDAIAERTGVSTSVATEEYLASLAEDTEFEYANKMGWWDKIKRYFVDMLRKLSMPGLNLKEEITDNELRYLLWRSYQNLVDPNSYLKPLGYLDDVAKQKELKVGNYAENTMATPSAAEGGNTPYGRENPYYNKKKSTRAQRDEIVKSIIRKGYNSVGTDVIKVGDYLFLIDHMDNEDFLNLFEGRKIPDGYGYGIRKKYNFAELTKDDIYEIVRNIAESYNYNEESIRDWLQELGLESRDLLELDIASELRGGDRDYGVGIGAGGGRRDKVDSNTSSSDSGKDKGEVVGEESEIRYRLVDDQAEIDRLESEPTIKAYRAMQVINGELYPPMSAVVDGKLREPIALGQWEQSEERPDLADDDGRFKLDKGNKKSLKAAYNPYFHSSSTPLNDQFSEAQDRDNLVTVEVEVPVSEADGTSGYKAEKAKDAVGTHQWKAGIIQGQLTGTREVFLTRWDKPVRIVPDSEVAGVIAKMLEGTGIVMPSNVVTPSLRAELEKLGVPFVETTNQGVIADGEHKGEGYGKVYGKKSTKKSKENAEIIAEVEREAAALGVPVRIVRSVDELPDEDTRKRAVDGQLKGYFDPRTGEVVVYEPNTDNANDAKRTVLHEIVGHKGLRQLIGEERYDKAMVQLMYMLPSEVRDAVLRRAERHGWNAAIAMDEYLAEQAERDVQPTWWGKVNAKIRALLRNIGFNVMLTDADVTYLLWRSRKKLMGDTAFDMATNAILKQAARKSAEADAWNEQAFKDAEMRDFEKGAMQRLRNRIGDAQNEYDSAMKSTAFKQRESWQDSMRSLKVFMDIVAKESGKKIADWENAYMYENAMSSANLMEMQMFRHDVYGRLLKAINELMESGAKYEEVVDYMMAKHGLERNEKMARKRAEKEAEGDAAKEAALYAKYRGEDLSGLTALTGVDNVADAEAATMQMIADFEAKHNTDLLWNETRACTQTILNISHDAGILSDKVYDELWNQYEYYIPLRGFDETTAEEVYTYVGDNKSPYNAPIKTAKGRKSKADDPIATIATMAESAIVEANRNRLKQRFLYMVERHRTELASVSSVWVEKDPITGDCVARFANIPNDATPEEAAQAQKAFEERMEQLHEQEPDRYYKASEKSNIPYRVEKKANEHEHQVIVKRNGKDVVITINGDPRVAQAINGLTNAEAVEGFSKFAGKVNRFLSANFTTRNPAFVVSNFVRDGFYTNSMVWAKESPAYAWKYNQNFTKATMLLPSLVSKYKRYEKGDKSALDMSDPVERAFYEFMINGGETGYTVINSVEDYKGIVAGDLKTMQGGVVGNTKKAVQAVGEVLDTFGRWAEDTSRFAAFLTSREMGRSVTKSIWDAKEISVNFNKKGSGRKMTQHDKGMNSILGWMSQQGRNLYVFWNAGMQGLYNFGKAAKDHPGKMAGLAGVYFGLGMAMAAIFGGHDDDEDYWNLPEYVRRNNICFRVGNKFVTLPLPIELRAIYGMGELAMSWMAGKEDPKKVGMKVVQQMSQVMPIDMMAEGGGLMAFVPSWGKPIVEVGANTDWTGMPIYRKRTPWNEHDPQWMLAFKSTSPELVAASRAINEATNKNLPSGKENKYDSGWADIEYLNNPAAWEHVVEGYLGGLATMFNQTKKSVMALWNKDLREVRNIPVVSRFVKDAGEKSEEYALREDYFNAKGVVDELRSQRGHFRKESIDPSLTEEQRKDVMDSRIEMEEMVNSTISQWNNLENARKRLEDMAKDNPDQEVTFDGKKGKAKDALDEVTRRMVKLTEGYQ